MNPDPRWLEVLKAGGWQTAAVAAACGLFLMAVHLQWLPPLEPWMVLIAAAGLLLFGCLAVASFLSAYFKFFPVHEWLSHWVAIHRGKRAARDYIQYMTPKERQIIAYLLAKNQKMFTCASDGGYAATLISRGLLVPALRRGQAYTVEDMPIAVPEHIWGVFLVHKDQFPYTPERGERGVETHPWRVPWMLR
jgi:Super-infection exclusion protein B